ncbi:histidine kinase dimerization/phospho-acceptor domain-containing protein [Promicromonospora panici]|uniref:histidine kinase dimerization/phospho-acceptor domain-containing protein n=1 Tax=Promicromonospora panici TaxID=2219658 RepID=UPI00101BECDE|nr:histidine kinase dimerization/phospho-acceptor domain-containing protein [Promicromonospora panici]
MSTRRDAEAGLVDAATGHAIFATDDDGVVVVFSRGAEILLGYPRDEVLGSHVTRILDEEELRAALAGDLDTDAPAPRDRTLRRRDGVPVLAQVVVTRGPDVEGAPAGHLFVAIDVTERRRAERLQDELIAQFGHDLRSPLTSVVGYAQLLDAEPLTDEQHAYVNAIERNGRRLLDLINELQAEKP